MQIVMNFISRVYLYFSALRVSKVKFFGQLLLIINKMSVNA